MLYLGIDQHARQLTVSLRGENGDVLLARQVSTEPDRVQAFFTQLTRDRLGEGSRSQPSWGCAGSTTDLVRMLHVCRCRWVILSQPDERKGRKTDAGARPPRASCRGTTGPAPA